jgi:hypothetical protein
MILPGAANISCLTGDTFLAISEGGGNWRVMNYTRGSAVGAGVELGDILPIGALDYAGFVDIATALNMDLGAVDTNQLRFTGSTTVGGFGVADNGVFRMVVLQDPVQINHSASLQLPGAANISGLAGDMFTAQSLGSGNWIVSVYQRANGAPVGGFATTTDVLTGTNTAKAVTPDALAALWERGTNVAAAATMSFAEGGYFVVTGPPATVTDIDFATPKNGRVAFVRFQADAAGTILTHNATSLQLPGNANITVDAGDKAIFVQDGADNILCISYQRATSTGFSYLRTVQYTGSATYTPGSDVDAIMIEMVGGGGGGGAAGADASNNGAGAGGAGGAYVKKWVTPLAASYPLTIGAAGAGGVASGTSGAAGGAGGSTTIDGMTAPGGGGGLHMTARNTVGMVQGGAGSGPSGAAGAMNAIRGGAGSPGILLSTAWRGGGIGGDAAYVGVGGRGVVTGTTTTAGSGQAGGGYGGGGSGALSGFSAPTDGSDGSIGSIWIQEYRRNL